MFKTIFEKDSKLYGTLYLYLLYNTAGLYKVPYSLFPIPIFKSICEKVS